MNEPQVAVFHQRTLANRLATWIAATRPAFLTASVLPVLVGVALSWQVHGVVDWLLACPEKGFFVPIESETTDSL